MCQRKYRVWVMILKSNIILLLRVKIIYVPIGHIFAQFIYTLTNVLTLYNLESLCVSGTSPPLLCVS